MDQNSQRKGLTAIPWLLVFAFLLTACEPLATGFEETEPAQYYQASTVTAVPDTFTAVRVMTWNIRFGAGRRPWFGDACGNRSIFTEEEILSSLQLIADKINALKPDILLLQEVDLKSKRSAYIDEMQWLIDHTYFNYGVSGYQWKTQFIASDGLGRLESTNATLSRWPIRDAQRIDLGLRGDQDALTRYFYERCCMVTGRVEIPGHEDVYTVNIHASAYATDDTRQRHFARFGQELKRINDLGGMFAAGGDFNTLPPGSLKTDFCLEDMCQGESFHQEGIQPFHKEGSYYTPAEHWLDTLYLNYNPAVTLQDYWKNEPAYFTQSTRSDRFWDRTLDYLFTNYNWAEHSTVTHQDALLESDHAPVSAILLLR